MPRTLLQNESLRAATRGKLLDAALALFARDGYGDTTVRAIAREAGVATGLLYSHFAGKEALLRALFEQSMSQVRLSFAMAESVPPDERIGALVRASVQLVREHRDFWRLGYAARTQPAVIAALSPVLGEWTDAIVGTLCGYLADAGSPSPELDARALFAQIDGMCQHFALSPGEYPVDAVADRVVAQWSLP
ncbi:MAG: TetR/AcrR family transcriptional regulator [Gemmatimonadaceae bacterium]